MVSSSKTLSGCGRPSISVKMYTIVAHEYKPMFWLRRFVNTLAMRGKPEANKTYKEFLEEVKEISLKAYENQEYPFEELVEAVDVTRDMSRNPLFDVMLSLQNNEEENLSIGKTETEVSRCDDHGTP